MPRLTASHFRSFRRCLPLTALAPLCALSPLTTAARPQPRPTVSITTYHNDNARTGTNLEETALAPSSVNPRRFGKLFSQNVDGYVYAQPLYLPGVTVKGRGVHNVLFVATQHDSVYAFDAESARGADARPLWQTSFIKPAQGITTVPFQEVGTPDIVPEIGITGTPVIDRATGTMYVVAKTREVVKGSVVYAQRLHALDVSSGAEKLGGPVLIAASVPGTGDGSQGSALTFDPRIQNQRAGLVLSNGVVYISWASHGDVGPYHGWVMGYDARTLRQLSVYNDTPDGFRGGIWQAGGAPAADSAGNLFFTTGNGTFNLDSGGQSFGDSFVRLAPGAQPQVTGFFTPFNQADLEAVDADLGSGGVVLLPDAPGPHPHLLVAGGKEGKLYLVDRDTMGGYTPGGPDHVLQTVLGSAAFSTPAFFNGMLYFNGAYDTLKAFSVVNGSTANVDRSGGFTTGSGLTLNGSAKLVNGRLRLTDDFAQASSAWATAPVNAARFSTRFTFQLQPGTQPIADGITFTLQAGSPGALGGGGGALGYLGMGHSVAVKFDTYNNAGEGTNSTGLYTNGTGISAPAVDLSGTGISLNAGNPIQATLDYNGTTLEVHLRDLTTGGTAQQSYRVDIPGTLNSSVAFAGFTAGTGGLFGVQEILDWTYTAPALSTSVIWPEPASHSAGTFGFPGMTPSISADGRSAAPLVTGVVWGIAAGRDAGGQAEATLHAFAASDVSRELYSSNWLGGADDPGGYVKFTVPTVANGRVYVGAQGRVTAFGMLPGLKPRVVSPGVP